VELNVISDCEIGLQCPRSCGLELVHHLPIRDATTVDGDVAAGMREDQIVDEFILLPVVAEVFLERRCDTMKVLETDLAMVGK
jgi:hypothetical protein